MTQNDTHIQELRRHHVTIQGQNKGQGQGRQGVDQGGEQKLIADHDASLANGQDTQTTNPGTAIFNIRLLTRFTVS